MSLIKKLTEKTKKRIVATVLAGGIALSGLGMTGCTSCNPDPNNTNPPITNPGGDNGGTQAPGNNNGGNSGSQTPDYSKYSQILQNVLTDDYYTSIASIENSDTDYGKKRWSYNHPKALSIPYGFLEDEGLDIESIKSKYLPVKSCIYLIENDLYIEVLAGIKSTTKFITDENIYYANYLLKYNLTNQELKEIKTLFTPLGIDFKTTYIQAPLFVQELSYLKTPEVLSHTYITPDSIEAITQKCYDHKYTQSSGYYLTYTKVEQTSPLMHYHTFQTHNFDGNSTDPSTTNTSSYLYTMLFYTISYTDEYSSNNHPVYASTKSSILSHTFSKQDLVDNAIRINLLSANNSNFKDIRKENVNNIIISN